MLALFLAGSACRSVLGLEAGRPFDDDGGSDAGSEQRAASELCANGVDDDGDGLVDCADPDCITQGYQCIQPASPVAWSGLAAAYEADSRDAWVPCENPFITPTGVAGGAYADLSRAPVVAQASCRPCTCAPAGICEPPRARLFADTTCSAQGSGAFFLGPGCVALPTEAPTAAVTFEALAPPPSPSCVPSDTSPSPARWASYLRICASQALTAAGCVSPAICAPPPPPGARRALCVVAKGTGEATCPPGFPVRDVLFTGIDDRRTCTACQCGSPTNARCVTSAELRKVANGSCVTTEAPALVVRDTACRSLPTSFALGWSASSAAEVSCEASGGLGAGSAVPEGPRTLCCRAPSE